MIENLARDNDHGGLGFIHAPGLPRPEAGRGNRALVAEGYATMLATGVYQLAASPERVSHPMHHH